MLAYVNLRGAMIAASIAVLLITTAGCGNGTREPPPEITAEAIAAILRATLNPLTPEQVAEAFALRSEYTDLQRELIEKDLVGSVVEWDIPVYEVRNADGSYSVVSQPIPIESGDAIQLLRVVAQVWAQRQADHDLMHKLKTDQVLRIRGRVQDITLRTVVTIGPAVVIAVDPVSE